MRSEAQAAMQRTEHIKHTVYLGDGQGRDNYIIHNDGGLIKPMRQYAGMQEKTDYMRNNSP